MDMPLLEGFLNATHLFFIPQPGRDGISNRVVAITYPVEDGKQDDPIGLVMADVLDHQGDLSR